MNDFKTFIELVQELDQMIKDVCNENPEPP